MADGELGRGVLDRTVFDGLYGDGADPWEFLTSPYEARKRALTLAALPRETYRRAFEPGCSLGILTESLATRCEELLAADVSPRAVARARERLAGAQGVRVVQLDLPRQWPNGGFDLVVFSELGYFLSEEELDAFVERAAAAIRPGGDLIAVHWRGPIEGYPLDGAAVHARLDAQPRLERLVRHVEREFLLEVFRG